MDGMRKEQTDNFCQFPANEGATRAALMCMHAHVMRFRVFLAREIARGCNCMKFEIKRGKSKICEKIDDLFAYVGKM